MTYHVTRLQSEFESVRKSSGRSRRSPRSRGCELAFEELLLLMLLLLVVVVVVVVTLQMMLLVLMLMQSTPPMIPHGTVDMPTQE